MTIKSERSHPIPLEENYLKDFDHEFSMGSDIYDIKRKDGKKIDGKKWIPIINELAKEEGLEHTEARQHESRRLTIYIGIAVDPEDKAYNFIHKLLDTYPFWLGDHEWKE